MFSTSNFRDARPTILRLIKTAETVLANLDEILEGELSSESRDRLTAHRAKAAAHLANLTTELHRLEKQATKSNE